MKINIKAAVKAVLILVFLTVLPIIGLQWIPAELLGFIQTLSGFNLTDLLNRIAVLGAILSALVLIRGNLEKSSSKYLHISTVWKIYWLVIVFFLLGIGHPETLGLAVLGGRGG